MKSLSPPPTIEPRLNTRGDQLGQKDRGAVASKTTPSLLSSGPVGRSGHVEHGPVVDPRRPNSAVPRFIETTPTGPTGRAADGRDENSQPIESACIIPSRPPRCTPTSIKRCRRVRSTDNICVGRANS